MVLGLTMVFILGLATRIYLEKYTYIFGFDSYWFARMASYIIQDGHLPKYDPVAFRGYPPVPITWQLSMNFPAWAYHIVYGAKYLQQNLLTVFKWLPASFGATGSLIMGIFGYILGGPLLGMLTGFFAATNPGYIYRTLSGFYEDDATSFLIPLAFLFAYLAYRSKDKKQYWIYTTLAGITLLIQAISWDGFFIVPYTVVVFSILYLAYVVLDYLRSYVPDNVSWWDWAIIGIGGLFAVLAGVFIKTLAYSEAADALAITGSLTATTLYTLATPYIAIFFFGVAATATVLWLRSDDRKYLYITLGSVVFAILTYMGPVNNGFVTEVTDANGIARRIGFQNTSFAMMFLGSLLMILVSSLAGSLAALLYEKRKDMHGIIDWRLLGVVFIPLLFATLSGPINGYNWYKPVITTVQANFFPEISKGFGTQGSTAQPHMGFIEPKTAGAASSIIGEETYGFANWPAKYGILAVIVLASIPFLFYRSEKDKYFLFLLAWLALTWWAAWYKLKFCYYLGLPIAIASAVVLADTYSRVASKQFKAAVMAVIVFLSVSMISTAVYHTATRIPMLLTSAEAQEMNLTPKGLPLFSASSGEDYIAMFKWIDTNTPKDANLLNWWSIGHWLTFFTGRGVMTDNTNHYYQADVEAAQFYLAPDENTAYAIASKRHMNYVIFQPEFLWQGYPLAIYALQTQNLRDPRLENYAAGKVDCQRVGKSIVTGKPYYICLQNGSTLTTLSEEQWVAIPPFEPQYYREFNEATRIRIGDREYAVYKLAASQNGGSLILLAPGMDNSMIVRMLLGVPMMHFTPVWTAPHGGVMIYKIQ